MPSVYTLHNYATPADEQMHTLTFINNAIRAGASADMILVAEAWQERQLTAIAETIAARHDTKIVLLAGPSSSGKTSTCRRLSIQLMASHRHPVALSTDNWYVARDRVPCDAQGAPDFETIYAMDLEQFNADLAALLRGDEVSLPTYNFTRGAREYRGERLRMTADMLLVVEGLHALNPLLTEHIPAANKYKLFVAPQSPISLDGVQWIPTTVNRLLRRISRDCQTRGKTAQQTIASWGSVRRGEKRWVLPYAKEADAVFDTSMLYELAALRPKAEEALRAVPHDSREWRTAKKLLHFLTAFSPIAEEQIPSTSLLREFIGNSIFNVV